MQYKIKALAALIGTCSVSYTGGFVFVPSNSFLKKASTSVYPENSTSLQAKKKKNKGGGGGGGYGGGRGQQQQEKQSVQDARFDAATRQFMFTMVGLSKTLPDKSKTILDNIHLSFYPGAKIGVVGLNGSGKSTLLKIMAGVEKEFDGTTSTFA